MIRSPVFKLLACVALACAASANAQDAIYRGVDAKGQTVYSNSPKGLAGARKIMLPEPVLAGTEPPQAAQASAGMPAAPPPLSGGGAASRAEQTQARLRDAQRAFDAGDEPAPGERLGTAGGGSRLAPSYYERRDREAKTLAEARAAAESGAR